MRDDFLDLRLCTQYAHLSDFLRPFYPYGTTCIVFKWTDAYTHTQAGKILDVLRGIVKNPEKRASVWSYVSLARRNLDQDSWGKGTITAWHCYDIILHRNLSILRSGRFSCFLMPPFCKDDVHYAREMLGSAGSQRGRLGSDVSGGRPRAESDASAASKQSKQSGEDHVKRTHTDQDDQMDTPGTMKDSIIAAASKSELPSVQWPALSILLELAWDEELKMSLINCNVPESWQQDASNGKNAAGNHLNHFICVSAIYSFNMFQHVSTILGTDILSHSDSAFFTLPISQGASYRSFAWWALEHERTETLQTWP